ncbi:MAG: beta-galactosidase trimerization domain-containing protein, partial [Bryobacteraceae bacterium]
ATALAAGAGMVYWGLSRFFYQPDGPLSYESGRYVKETFDFEQKYSDLLANLHSQPQVGLLVGSQTIDWYQGRKFVHSAYPNYFHGAYLLLKAQSYEPEPFLDWQMSPDRLKRYHAIFAPNVACLSEAQCRMLADYVRNGGKLLATHLTSIADEYGRVRPGFGLEDLFGAAFLDPEPVEIPDLYLKLPSGELIPQDPQIMKLRAAGGKVLAETFDRGHGTNLGPAVLQHNVGRGAVLYIGSGLEAVYDETRMQALRAFFEPLLSPWLAARRSYEVEFRPGLMPHLTASENTLVLHLLADTGDRVHHLQARENFLPIQHVKVRIRIPHGRALKSAMLMRAGHSLEGAVRNGWFTAVVPRVWIHEAVRLDLG